MGEMDVTFRHLLRNLPQPILRLAFPRHQLEPLGPFDASVDRARQLTTDSLFRIRHGDADAAMHIEIERDWRPSIPPRLFDYASAAVAATRLPVTSIVVLLRPGGNPPRDVGVHRIPDIDGDAFIFRYHVVPLWSLDAREMRMLLGLQSAPYLVPMRGADEAFLRSVARELKTDHQLAESARQNAKRLLYIVLAAMLGADTAERIYTMESLIEDPNVQEMIRGWKDKGRAEGRALATRELLHKVLVARSLPVTEDVRTRIEREPDIARLESWLEAASTATTIGDVFRDG
jgi:hypothetical protein